MKAVSLGAPAKAIWAKHMGISVVYLEKPDERLGLPQVQIPSEYLSRPCPEGGMYEFALSTADDDVVVVPGNVYVPGILLYDYPPDDYVVVDTGGKKPIYVPKRLLKKAAEIARDHSFSNCGAGFPDYLAAKVKAERGYKVPSIMPYIYIVQGEHLEISIGGVKFYL